jgi:tripartite-type tricarboxylate transporter receptor subunit TctC
MKKIIATLALAFLSVNAMAQSYPAKPVKIILSLGVGSGPDVMARKISEVLTEKWKQPVVVENRPGGAGVIGLNAINSEPSDGYTLGFLDGGSVVAYSILYKNAETISRLEPIAPVLDANMALFASSQIRNYGELKQEIAKNPSYSSWNIGSVGHVLGAEFGAALGNKFAFSMTHVPYKDFGQWQADVATRQVPYAFGSTGTTKNMVQAGKTKLFGIATLQRDPRYPDIPTIKELTGKNITTLIAWCSFYVSTNTPAAVKTQLERNLKEAIADPRVQETMSKFDFIPIHTMSLANFKQKVKNDQDRYQTIVDNFKIAP